jgi:menaquinone-dependent protoporphyrinogen IX oxidase
MKTLIIYRSFLGTSRKYAEWLHEAVPSDLLEYKSARGELLKSYDTVVIMNAIYATRLSLAHYLEQNWPALQKKRIVFVLVSGSPADNVFSTKAYSRIPENIRTSIKPFHLTGSLGRLGFSLVKKENLKPIVDYLRTNADFSSSNRGGEVRA